MQPFLMGFTPFACFTGLIMNDSHPGGQLTAWIAAFISPRISSNSAEREKGPFRTRYSILRIFIALFLDRRKKLRRWNLQSLGELEIVTMEGCLEGECRRRQRSCHRERISLKYLFT